MIAGANEVDHFLLEDTLLSVIVERPAPEQIGPEHLCLDAGYDNATGHNVAGKHGYAQCPSGADVVAAFDSTTGKPKNAHFNVWFED